MIMTTIRKWLCSKLCEQKVCTESDTLEDPYPQQIANDRAQSHKIVSLFDNPTDGEPTIKVNDFYITDRSFKLVDIDHLRGFLYENPVSKRKYVKEEHDCDDFAYILQGDVTRWDSDLAFGIIHGRDANGNSHAWNVCIGLDMKVWFIEPQNDAVWKVTGEWKVWFVLM
jgi:hypothetical protein